MTSSMYVGIPAISTQNFGIVLVVIALYLTFRIYKNMKGMKYSAGRVYRAPIIYFVLLLIEIMGLNPSYLDIVAIAIALMLGYALGRRLAGGVRFFDKNGITYYKRSPIILGIWLVSFVARIGLEYITIPGIAYIAIIVEIALALTTGMIAGEAHHINNAYKKYGEQNKTGV